MPVATRRTHPSTPKLSEAARELVYSPHIVKSGWPRIKARLADMAVKFDPWQESACTLVLGKTRHDRYAHTVGGIVWSIPRQVGKTFTIGSLLIAMCIEFPGLVVVWTAHHSRTSTSAFRAMQGMVRRPKVRVHLASSARSDGIRSTNGEQEISFRNGSIIMFGAREQGFGRGIPEIDVEVFDEAQILRLKALEDMVAATNQAKHPHGALLFFIGTPPRPSDPGEAFTEKRRQALDREVDDMMYLEFSADPASDPDDRSQWPIMNPSYPKRTPLESMLRLRRNLPDEDSWNREGRGIWDPKTSSRVIDQVSWDAIADPSSMPIDRLTLAIDVAPDRSVASVALAGLREDGLWHVELDEHRKGADWTIGWVKQRAAKNELHAVVVDELAGLTEKRHGRNYLKGTNIEVTLMGGREQAIASAGYFDAVMGATARHTDQPQVNVSLSVAGKRDVGNGAGWAWSKKSAESDITPTVAQTDALWGAQNDNVKRPIRNWSTSGGGGWVA